MKAGILKEKIEIYESVETVTEYGNKNFEWKYKCSTRAGIIHKGGSRTIENNEIIYPVQKDFIVRYYVPIDERMRIKFDNKFYRIISIDKNKYYNDQHIVVELIND